MEDYRKLYEQTYHIKWDKKKYEVHHIDLNHENNDPKNLVLVPKVLHHQYHCNLQILKTNITFLSEIWIVDMQDIITSPHLENFAKYKHLMALFLQLRFCYEQDTEEKNMDNVTKIFMPQIYKEYKLGE